MSVYIKGMEMQENCYGCPVNKDDGFGFFTCGVTHTECDFNGLPSDCPLIPVPDHGRLIDTSAKVQTQLYDDQTEDWIDADMTVEEYLGYCFNEVPTIIPASKEGET